jgi:hypothetical protein
MKVERETGKNCLKKLGPRFISLLFYISPPLLAPLLPPLFPFALAPISGGMVFKSNLYPVLVLLCDCSSLPERILEPLSFVKTQF